MGAKSRRDFLGLCIASVPALAVASKIRGSETTQQEYRTPATLERYINPLPIPKTLRPYSTSQAKTRYRVRILECKQQLHSQLPPTTVWGFEGQYPGPTIEAQQNRLIEIRWENHLPARHLFDIDPQIHGAGPPAPPVRTVPHLHGSRTQSISDGLPEKWFTPGTSDLYSYPNCQPPATLWYHDHAIGVTRLNVYAGLSGFYLLRNEEERKMNLPSGEYEIPLLLQDRTLNELGQLAYFPTMEDGAKLPPGVWGPEFFGDLPVVNGAIYPYLEVEPRRYRLRVLNGANSRFFRLYLNLAKQPTDIPSLVEYHQIGTDGGLLPGPVALNKLLLAPAERADLIVDFSGLEGKIVTLGNDAPAPFPGWEQINSRHPRLYELMQFRVSHPLSRTGSTFSLPPQIALPALDEKDSVVTRDFVLSERMDGGRSLGVRINDKGYHDPVTERVRLGSIEKWRFINNTDDAHPMHLHLVQFKILERQGFNPATVGTGTLGLLGPPRPPAANEAGWKDTAVVQPRDVLTILIRFEGYTGRYV
jgi:spore coat protein A